MKIRATWKTGKGEEPYVREYDATHAVLRVEADGRVHVTLRDGYTFMCDGTIMFDDRVVAEGDLPVCPFCGGEAIDSPSFAGPGGADRMVGCPACELYFTGRDARIQWSTRCSVSDGLRAENARMRAALVRLKEETQGLRVKYRHIGDENVPPLVEDIAKGALGEGS